MSDYLKCPRAYYLKNIYRRRESHHKITLMQPPLALGQVVHEVLDQVSQVPKESRFSKPLIAEFEKIWRKFTGKNGGFNSQEEEQIYKNRGKKMLERVQKFPGPLLNPAIKLRQYLPYYWLSDTENIILCGKIDWLEYIPKTNSLHVIDFKTGKTDEDEDSLQLLSYYLLVKNCQLRLVTKLSYWYLDRDNAPLEMKLPDGIKAHKTILEIGNKIALARKLEHFKCLKKEGCYACSPFEAIIQNKAEFIGVDALDRDVYVFAK